MLGHKAKHQRFAQEYAKDLDAPAAALRAGYSQGYSENAAVVLLGNPRINKLVARELRYAENCAGLTPARMISHLIDRVSVDPTRISWVETRPCLNCYSAEDRQAYFDAGLGAMELPSPQCKLCNGQGVQQVRLADSKTLTRAERQSIKAYKQDKDGVITVVVKDSDKELAHLLDIMKLTGNLNISVSGQGDVDVDKLMAMNPKDMTNVQLEMAMRIQQSRLEAKTIDGR